MPGLVGVISLSPDPRERARVTEFLPTLLAPLCHRPEYYTDTYLDPQHGLAIARLHLGILNPSPQPYSSPHTPLKVFLHGEIYNDDIPADRQLECIAELYARLGPTFPAHLNGSFLVLLHDAARHLLLLATDRTGSKPLFYALHNDYLYFAPELKALAHVPTLPKTLDLTALASFLSAGYFLNGHTLLHAVRLLDNATLLQLTPIGLTTQRYWHYTFEEAPKDLGRAHYQHTLADLLRTAVHRRLRTPHRYGLLLSGGYDSRALLGYALAQPPTHPLHTISWGASEDIPHSDCAIAARLARRLALPHTFYPLRAHALPDYLHAFIALSDGLTDAVTNYPEATTIFHHIRHDLGLDIILRGDECFGWIASAFDERTMFQTLGIHSLDHLKPYQSMLTADLRPLLEGRCKELLNNISARCSAENVHNRKDFFYLDQRLQYYLHPLTYIKTLEVEVRTPYLDNDILDFVRSIPPKYRIEKCLFKEVVTANFPEMFDEIADSANLIDWNAELRKPYLKDFMYALLVSKESSLADFLDMMMLASILHEFFASHQTTTNHTGVMKTLRSMLVRSPSLYTFVQRGYRSLPRHREWNPMSRILFRLVTLRVSMETLSLDRARAISR